MVMHKALVLTIAAVLLLGCAASRPSDAELATELDGYARLLADSGQTARSEEVAGYAARLREAETWNQRQAQAMREGRPPEGSFYLGFAPDQVLAQYAADLRGGGKAADAARVEELAAAYRAEQTRAVEALLRQRGMQP